MLDDIYHTLDPVAFSVGPFAVRWYGIGYVLGFAVAALLLYKVSKRWKLRIDADSVLTIMVCVIIGIIIGARLGYCLFYGNGYYLSHPLEIFAINQGGMSFHGGLIGALVSGIVAAKITSIPYLTLADLGAIAATLGIFMVRCANFINGELWGAPTDLPCYVWSVPRSDRIRARAGYPARISGLRLGYDGAGALFAAHHSGCSRAHLCGQDEKTSRGDSSLIELNRSAGYFYAVMTG